LSPLSRYGGFERSDAQRKWPDFNFFFALHRVQAEMDKGKGNGDRLGIGVLLADAVPVPISAPRVGGYAAGFARTRDGAS
jgi:hypothetical protein